MEHNNDDRKIVQKIARAFLYVCQPLLMIPVALFVESPSSHGYTFPSWVVLSFILISLIMELLDIGYAAKTGSTLSFLMTLRCLSFFIHHCPFPYALSLFIWTAVIVFTSKAVRAYILISRKRKGLQSAQDLGLWPPGPVLIVEILFELVAVWVFFR